MSLSEMKLRKAAKDSKPYKLFDGDGLHVLVKPSGSKIWRLKYHILGKEKTLTLGRYPEISLAKARELQFEARKLLSQGIDPSARKREDKLIAECKAMSTFKAITIQWHESMKSRWEPRHAQRTLNRFENHVFPYIGQRSISEIKPLELLSVFKRIESQGKLATVHRVLNYTQCVFRYAVVIGLIESNPARELGIAIKPMPSIHYPSIKESELKEFLSRVEATKTSIQNKLALKLQLLTFLRSSELRKSKWEYVNFESKEWKVPADLMKMKCAHVVPLSHYSISLLKQLKTITGESQYLFPSSQKRRHPFMSENTVNYVIELAGYKGRLVAHGFRSLASTTLNEEGFNKDAIERQLAHKEPNKIRAAYNYAEYMPERIKMMDWWGRFVENCSSKNDW